MKSNFKILYLLLGLTLIFSACEKDEIDVDALTDFPPGVLSTFPSGKTVKGDFDIKVTFVDGTTSPLASAEVSLLGPDGAEITTASKTLSGTTDSLVIPAADFDAASLDVGNYTLEISVTDSKNQTANSTVPFEISLLPFPANYNEMYLAGNFNGWGADAMELVAPNTWELREVDFGPGTEWKLKNTVDWTDQDWGDGDCDGFVANTTGGGANTNCSHAGLVNFRFNDQTLQYTIEPAITFAQNVSALYLLGSFNDFQGSDYAFVQTEDNIWTLNEILLENGAQFRFSEGPQFMGTNFGSSDTEGVASEFGDNIVFSGQDGFYSMTFNDKTLEYSIDFVRFPSIGIIGDATPGGWDADTDLTDNGDGTFSLLVTLTDGEAKFRANDDWATNWGAADFPSGVAVQDGPNIPVTAGTYLVTFSPETGAYSFEPGIEFMGIIGDATPGGWDTDTEMLDMGDGVYQAVIGLTDGVVKFRANKDWPTNWGGTDFPSGIGTQDGDNISVTAGIYLVTLNINDGSYSFATASIGIIGSATASGWDADTDMTADPSEPGLVTLTADLTDGEAKFRLNNDWQPFNWGGSDFPSGVATKEGPNIPVTAGSYTIKFNVNTGAYSFE